MGMPPHGMLPLAPCMGAFMPHHMQLCGGGSGGPDMCPPPPRGSGAESPSPEDAAPPHAAPGLFAAHEQRACAPVCRTSRGAPAACTLTAGALQGPYAGGVMGVEGWGQAAWPGPGPMPGPIPVQSMQVRRPARRGPPHGRFG
jgi:hypothetical protein